MQSRWEPFSPRLEQKTTFHKQKDIAGKRLLNDHAMFLELIDRHNTMCLNKTFTGHHRLNHLIKGEKN